MTTTPAASSASCNGGCSGSAAWRPTRGWARWAGAATRAVGAITELQGRSIAFIGIEADVDRMIQTPGKVAAEGLGALMLSRLRPAGRRAWPAFHRAVLQAPPWPLAALERRLRARAGL